MDGLQEPAAATMLSCKKTERRAVSVAQCQTKSVNPNLFFLLIVPGIQTCMFSAGPLHHK